MFLINPILRTRSKTRSAQLGLFLNSCKNVEVSNPYFTDVNRQVIYITKDGTDNTLSGVGNVKITGGFLHTPNKDTAYVIQLDTKETKTSNIFISGVVCSGRQSAARIDDPTTITSAGGKTVTGAYVNCNLGVKFIDNNADYVNPPIQGGLHSVLDYEGPIFGNYGMPSKEGGRYLNAETGERFLRKDGTWIKQ